MDLRGLQIFIEVAEQKSFTRAGEQLGYSQPTVSFQIRQLEQELGVPLFDRIGHTVSLTDAGREALAYAQKICNLSREMTLGTRQDREISGVIRIGMADALGKLPPEDTNTNEAFLRERLAIYRDYMARPFVAGRDLVEAGLTPGPDFSDILAYAHKLRLAGVEKESALLQPTYNPLWLPFVCRICG